MGLFEGMTRAQVAIGIFLGAIIAAVVCTLSFAVFKIPPEILLWADLTLSWIIIPVILGAQMGMVRSVGPRVGWILGLLFGFFGLIVLLFYPVIGRVVECPRCAERIRAAARVCRYCHQSLRPAT